MGARISGGDVIYPCLRVLPVGCNWAACCCQIVFINDFSQSHTLDLSFESHDHKPPPTLQKQPTMSTNYIDNVLFLGVSQQAINGARVAAASALRGAGLPVHEEMFAGPLM